MSKVKVKLVMEFSNIVDIEDLPYFEEAVEDKDIQFLFELLGEIPDNMILYVYDEDRKE